MRQIELRHIASIRVSNVDKKSVEGDPEVRLCNYMDVYDRDFIRDDQYFMPATATQDQINTFRVQPGDVIITKDSETADDIGVPALVESSAPDLVCGYHLALLRPRTQQVDPRFLFWSMAANPAREQLAVAATGVTRFGLRADSISNLTLTVPTLLRQRAIADFLDTETARIDALLTRRRQQVALLDERFDAAIFHAITRGLRNERARACGLGWVSHIPQSWGTPTISSNFSVQLGKMLNPTASAGGSQAPYLRNVNVQWDSIETDRLATMHFDADDRRRFRLRAGDLLVCEGGEVGRAAVWDGQIEGCYYQKALHRLRPLKTASTRLLMYCLRAAARINVFTVEGNTSTIAHLTAEQLRIWRCPWPPPGEQSEIVSHLDKVDAACSRARRALDEQVRRLFADEGVDAGASLAG